MLENQLEFNLSLTFQDSVQTIIPYPNYVFFSILIFSVMAIISISEKSCLLMDSVGELLTFLRIANVLDMKV